MKKKICTLTRCIGARSTRLGFSIGLAFSLAFILFLIPVTTGTKVRLPVPDAPHLPSSMESMRLNQSDSQALDLLLPFGASPVYATGGLTISKTAPPTVDQGSVLTYSLIAINQTGLDLTGAEISDTLAAETTCIATDYPPSPPFPFWSSSCNTVAKWDMVYIPSIPVLSIPFANNTANVFTFNVIVDEPLPDQFEIINSSYIISATDGSTNYTDVGTPLTTKVNAPSWVITKSVSSDTIQPGDLLTYTITLGNEGHLASSGSYTITDPLPDNTIFVSDSASPPQSSFDGSTITWVLTNPVGINESIEVSYLVTVTQPLTNGTKIVNQNYSVSGGNVFTPSTVGEPITVTVESPATLSITKTASPSPVQAGELLTYTITITNDAASKGPVQNVMISDTLSGELFDQTAGFVGPTSGVVTDTDNPVLWQLADPIPVGDSVQVTVTARVTSPLLPRLITNTFSAWATNAPLVSDTLTSDITSTNVISLNKSVDPTIVAPGDPVTYTITLTNSGNSIATINLTDLLHSDFTPLTYTQSGLTLPGRSPFTTEDTVSVIFTATTPITPGTYYNQIITATYDLTRATVSDIAPVRVVSAAITITKIADPPLARIGDTITYTYIISNSGDITLTNISLLDDPLGPSMPLTTTLGPSESTTGMTSTVVTEDNLPGPITNTVTVTGTYLSENFVSATTMASVSITYTAAISLDKSFATSDGVPATLNDIITYTYRISNVGTVTLNDISLSDDKLGPIPVVPSTLAPGQGTEVTGTTSVVAADLSALLLTNLAIVTGSNDIVADSDVATATASVPLTYTASITVNKSYTTSGGLPAGVGDTISYTYRITNTSDVTLTLELYDDPLGAVLPLSNTLEPGETTSARSVKNVTQADLPGPITNTATVTGTSILFGQTAASDSAAVPLTYTTAISLAKSANVSSATIDDVITYTYIILNNGDVTLTNLTLADDQLGPIPLLTTSLMPGFFTSKEVSYTVSLADFPSPLTNTATVTGTDFAGAILGSTATATVTLVYTPDIQLVKTANVSVAAPGDTITYTYYLTNTGNVTMTNLVLTDDRLGPITNLGNTTLAPNLGTTGTATYTVQLSDIPVITNTAIVTGEDVFGLDISTSDTLEIIVDEILTTITAINSSPTIVNDTTLFTVTTNLESGITYTWDFSDGSSPTTVPVSTTTHTYTTVGVYTAVVTASNANGSISGTTVVTITPGPALQFDLQADSPQTAGNPFPITITAQDAFGNTVTDFNGPVTISDDTGTILPTTVDLVDGITTTNFIVTQATTPQADIITATSGTISGTVGVVIEPNLPDTVTVIASPTSGLSVCQSAAVTATVVDNWDNPVPDIPMGMSVDNSPPPPPFGPFGDGIITPTTSFTSDISGNIYGFVQGTAPGNISVEAFVSEGGLPLGQSDDINFEDITVPSDITVTVTPSTVAEGNSAIVSAQVGSCAGPVSDQLVTFTVGSLASISGSGTATTNASGVATTTVTGITAGVTTITATMAGPLVDTTPFTITVPTFPDLTITKTAIPPDGEVRPGQSISYEIVVSNIGTAPAKNVVITDALDSYVTFAGGSIVPTGNGPVDTGGGVITFSVSSLALGSSVTGTINVTINGDVVSGTEIINFASTASDEASPISTVEPVIHQVVTDTETLYLPIVLKGFVPPSPFDLTVRAVTVSNLTPETGEPVEITVTIHNTGTAFVTPFWVDLYLATTPIAPEVNQTWEDNNGNGDPDDDDDIVPYGVAWKVSGMPANGNKIITNLNPNDLTEINCDNYSNFIPNGLGCWPQTWKNIPLNNYFSKSGTYLLYVLVDSLDDVPPGGSPNGIILESNEGNNLFGPISISVSGSPLPTAVPSAAQESKPFTGTGRQVVRP